MVRAPCCACWTSNWDGSVSSTSAWARTTLSAFANAIALPNGIVLATGPTGSGKTTTLYAAVDQIRSGREKIVTVEDPVEYELSGVPQVQVNDRVGLTFASALRSLLRQDPDILLVGEVRDVTRADLPEIAMGTGCAECRGTGYRGRTGVYELLVLDDEIRSEVQKGNGVRQLMQRATRGGMRTLRQDALRLLADGVTTVDEVNRVVGG